MEKTNTLNKKGLTGSNIKLIAAFLMVLDHIYYYFAFTDSVPVQFKWVGRIVAPLFIYLTVEGYKYTRSKKKYLLRLYIASVLMNIGNTFISTTFERGDGVSVSNSMFTTMFFIVLYLIIIDFIIKSFKNKNIGKAILGIILAILPIAGGMVLFTFLLELPPTLARILLTIVPIILLAEGGLAWILMGVIFHLFRENKNLQMLAFAAFTIILHILNGYGFSVDSLLTNYQWMMIFAIPFIYLYNGEKGRNLKYFFYIFYPGHIYILYIISTFIQNNN